MKPTTIRLPQHTLDELDSEYGDYGYGDRSEYIRHIVEHRSVVLEHTQTTGARSPLTTDDYDRLEDRVEELEQRVADLESRGASSQREPRPRESESGVVEYVREQQPVSRADILRAFDEEIEDRGIKPDSWWRRHGRPALEEAGFEFVRNVGWRED